MAFTDLITGLGKDTKPQNSNYTETPDGGVEVELPEEGNPLETSVFRPGGHYENLAELIDDRTLKIIGSDVIDACRADMESREEWEHILAEGTRSLGLNPDDPGASLAPIEGGCTATHPIILESAVKFQSKLTAELLPAKGPARVQVIGADPEKVKELQAQRVQEFLNYQIKNVMTEYEDETDRMAFNLALKGSAFKKIYWDQVMQRPVSEYLGIDSFIVAETAKNLETAERYTHIIEKSKHAVEMDIDAGIFKEYPDYKLMGGEGSDYDDVRTAEEFATGEQPVYGADVNKVFTLYEQHVYMSLPEDIDMGDVLPYVITVNADTNQVLRIQRNWDPEDPKREMLQWFTHYKYVPGFGFHGLGLYHLLGDIQKTLTTVLRSLVDSGQLANLQGGFKLRGTRLSKESQPFAMGEWRDVDSTLQDISKSLYALPFKEPSATLYQLLEYLTGASQKFADSTEQVIADSSNYGPVGTTMALLEASVKFFSAIHKRCHRSQGKELKILARLNYQFLDGTYPYDVIGGERQVLKQDFDPKIVDVIPASDPNITSQAHRISLAQSKLQAALQDPKGMHDLREVYRDFYMALGVDDIDTFMPPPPEAQPLDPMSDIMAANQGQPIKAFPGQNHQAHVQFKMAWMQDPTQGASGLFQNILPLVAANVREHQLMDFQEKVMSQTQQGQQPGMPQQQGVQPTGVATDPQTMAQVMAETAAKVADANRMLAEEQAEGGPAGILAKAEMIKAQADMMKEARETAESKVELGIKLYEALVSNEREKTRAMEAQRKYELDEKKLQTDLRVDLAELDFKAKQESAKLASGEKNMFAKEAFADRRDSRKAQSEDKRESRNVQRENQRENRQVMREAFKAKQEQNKPKGKK